MTSHQANFSSDEDAFAGLSQQHREQLAQLKNANARLHELAWELEEVEQRLHALFGEREGPIDILVEREINELQRRHTALEDQTLHEMLRADELAARLAQVQRELGQRPPSENN